MKQSDFRFDVLRALAKMKGFFDLEETANRTLEGGWELLFRNRLLRLLREQVSKDVPPILVNKEWAVVPRKRNPKRVSEEKSKANDGAKIADIAFLKSTGKEDCQSPLAVIEIKHNFATQPQALTSVIKDVDKWSDWKRLEAGWKCEFYFIQIITDVKRLMRPSGKRVGWGGASRADFSEDLCKDLLKYGIQPDEEKRKARIDGIRNNLMKVQGRVDSGVVVREKTFSVSSSRYFDDPIDYEADIHVFLVSQRSGVCTKPKG